MAKLAKRALTISQVIELVRSTGLPVMRIERELGIPSPILARALKENTTKPLPVKYERKLVRYVKEHNEKSKFQEKEKIQVLESVGVEITEKETGLSQEEKDNKLFWLNAVKEARANALNTK